MPQPLNLSSNIWKYTLLLITNKRLFAPILGAYYLTVPGVTEQTIGLILLVGSIAGFLFEIPSGYASDKLGHKSALILSRALMVISSLLFLFADGVWWLMTASVFMSLSTAFTSGTDAAFFYETLRALGREGDYTRVMGKASSLGFAVPIIFTVLAPFLVDISYKAPFLLSLVVDLIGLFTAAALITPNVTPEHIREIGVTNFKQVIHAGYQLGFFSHASFTAIFGGIVFSTMIFRATHQVEIGVLVIYFGILFGLGRALASLLLAYSGKLRELLPSILHLFRFQLFFFSLLFLGLAFSSNMWVILALYIIINGFQWGLSQVERGFLLDIIRDSKFKATLLSAKSQLYVILQGVCSFGLGLLIAAWGYQAAFEVVTLVFLATLLPLYGYIKRKHQIAAVIRE